MKKFGLFIILLVLTTIILCVFLIQYWSVQEIMIQSTLLAYIVEYYLSKYIDNTNEIENKQKVYSVDDIIIAGEIGEINHHDVNHIVSYLDEAKMINNSKKDKLNKEQNDK
jgi:hypothetical protein